MSADATGLDGVDLRALVREVLREALPTTASSASDVLDGGNGDGGHARESGEATVVEVRVASDADLAALVRDVAAACADPARQARLAADGSGYRLAPPAGTGDGAGRADQRPVLRVERGAVTERHVREAARTGATVRTARGVVVTPLARDRARSAGVPIEKEA
jgi:hypothetical protein